MAVFVSVALNPVGDVLRLVAYMVMAHQMDARDYEQSDQPDQGFLC